MNKLMRESNGNRDWRVEAIRLIACLMVICIHILPSREVAQGVFSRSRTLISCVTGDAVGLFWMVTGCFFFKNQSYKKTIAHTLEKVVLPAFLCTLVFFFFGDVLVGGGSVGEGLRQAAGSVGDALKSIFTLNTFAPYTGTYWYVITYCLFIIISPIICRFVSYLDSDTRAEWTFMGISLAALIINDIFSNQTFMFSHHGFNALVPAVNLVIWGHILYRHRGWFQKQKSMIFLLIFAFLTLIRWGIQMYKYNNGSGDIQILYWYTSVGLGMAASLVLFFLTLQDRTRNFSSVISFLGSFTYPVYLVHMAVKSFLEKRGLMSYFKEHIFQGGGGTVRNILYAGSITLIIFAVSLTVCCIDRVLCLLIRREAQQIGGNNGAKD